MVTPGHGRVWRQLAGDYDLRSLCRTGLNLRGYHAVSARSSTRSVSARLAVMRVDWQPHRSF